MHRISMRHRTALMMLAATLFPVTEMITDIHPINTGIAQIDEAMRKISNTLRPAIKPVTEMKEKHIAILSEIEDMKSGDMKVYTDGLKKALEQIDEMTTYIDMITLGDLEEGLQEDELLEQNAHIQNELKRLTFGVKFTLDGFMGIKEPSLLDSDDEITI